MRKFLETLFSSADFMPHGGCYLWTRGLVALHVASDLAIGLAYVAISLTLVYLVVKGRRTIQFHSMFLAFGVFIVACGATHFMEVYTVWNPVYWLSGAVKLVTAIASVFTALALPPLLPHALRTVESARLAERQRRELEAANTELNRVYAQLKEFDQLKTDFFANVSHELRTPLALILGPTEKLLTSGRLAPQDQEDVALVNRNAHTLLKHVNDLLDIAKLDSGGMQVQYAEADLARLVRLAGGNFESLARDQEIRFQVETPEALPAEIDPEKVERVLLNLLSNAFKFTPHGGLVRCSVSPDAAPEGDKRPWGRITVADSGPGVPPHQREAIFERFRQLDGGSTRRFGGTGLGLAIAQDFATLHGGAIHAEDSPGGGATFVVRLPLRAPMGAAIRRGAASAGEARTGAVEQTLAELQAAEATHRAHETADGDDASLALGDDSRPLVMVLEDNIEMNRFIGATLGADYRVAPAYDGRTGLDRAIVLKPDLILSDLMMPELSGDRLLRAIRQRPEMANTPVMLLTAKADETLRAELLQNGAQDFLMKPFSAVELRARVKNLVSNKRVRDLLQQELESQGRDLEGLADEVTRRKRDLQSALHTTQAALEQAERANQVKTSFLRMVSHELRTPLTTIQLQLHLLGRDRESPLSARQQEAAKKMSLASERLKELIESLLEYARIESGNVRLDLQSVDLNTLTGEVVDELRIHTEYKGLALHFEGAAGVHPLRTDPRLLRLIVTNLIANAVKFTQEGTISITAAERAGEHCITVQDTGPGIPPQQQQTVFEPFQHLEPVEHKHTPGVGLGLSLVREMTAALGGRVELESEVGQGSRFTVVLPSAGPLSVDGASPSGSAPQAPTA